MAGVIVEKEVPDGDPAVDYTVKQKMCRLAHRDAKHPGIVALARRLMQGRTNEEAARAAFNYVADNVRYVKDPQGIEYVRAPKFVLRMEYAKGDNGIGDCDCMCTALGAVIFAMGFKVAFRPLAWYVNDYTHVNAVIILPDGTPEGRWIPVDPVMGRAGWNNQKTKIIRDKYYRCDMIVRSLEDEIAPDRPAPRAPVRIPQRSGVDLRMMNDEYRRRAMAARAQSARQPGVRQLGDCGCGCGGAKKKEPCCPKNQNRNRTNANSSGGVVVNVSPNFGRVDSSRFTDASGRYLNNAPANLLMGSNDRREVITRERPVVQRVEVPVRVGIPSPTVIKQVPMLIDPVKPPDDVLWKEFY